MRARTSCRRGRFIVGVLAALALVVVGSSPASAANPASSTANAPTIRKVDTSQYPTVSLTVLKPAIASDSDAIHVSENSHAITDPDIKTVGDSGVSVGVVLVLDASDAMTVGDAITKEKAAAVAMVQAKQANEQYALVAYNGTARRIVNFTTDANALISGINSLQATGDSALWTGVSVGAAMFQDQSAAGLQANLIIVSGTSDKLSPSGQYTKVESSIQSINAGVFSVAVNQNSSVPSTSLRSLATQTGGRFVQTSDPDSLTQTLTGLGAAISGQSVVTYQSPENAKQLAIQVGVGNGVATANTSPGTIAEGSQVQPVVVTSSHLPSIFTGNLGYLFIALVSFAGIGMLIYGLIEVVGNERNQLASALRPYSDDLEDESGERDFSKFADSQIIRKAVATTAKVASDRGLLQIVQTKLEQADLPLRPAEALFFTGVAAFVAMVVGAALKGILGLAGAGLIFAYLPLAITNFLAKRRKKKFTSQLPDTLQLLAGSLRAGYSLVQGLDAVSKQCEAPMGTELQRAMSEARLGRPVEEALQDISDRMNSDDFEWAVMAIKIQREVGGNLAELLVTVGETMVARERLRREVKALTAEGRISAVILVALPFCIGGLISVMNPKYMHPLYVNFYGQVALVGAVIAIIAGYFVMMKLIEIEA